MYTHILISTDGSELAQKGVDHGLSLADETVTIITVTEQFPVLSISASGWGMAGMDPDWLQDANTRHATAILAAAKAAAEEMGLTVETLHIPNATPAAAIVEAAKTHDCDLIIMASHGYRGDQEGPFGQPDCRSYCYCAYSGSCGPLDRTAGTGFVG